MKFLVPFVVLVLSQDVLSRSILDAMGNRTNTMITRFKDFSLEDYEKYLEDLLEKDEIPLDQMLDFPKTLTSAHYTLTDGKVVRFYEPITLYGSFNSIHFHHLGKEFFGISQIYGPKIDFSFGYTTTFQGSERKGKFSLVVSHDPVELQIDFGERREDGTCVVDTMENDVFYFYDEQLTLIPKFAPGSDEEAGKELVKEVAATWLGKLYELIMKVKVEKISADTKDKILKDSEFREKNLKSICKTVIT